MSCVWLQEAVSRATTLAQEVVELEAALLQAKSARIKVEKDAAESFDRVGIPGMGQGAIEACMWVTPQQLGFALLVHMISSNGFVHVPAKHACSGC
jgi:hypothetical protein